MASVLGKVGLGPDGARLTGLLTVWLHMEGDGELGGLKVTEKGSWPQHHQKERRGSLPSGMDRVPSFCLGKVHGKHRAGSMPLSLWTVPRSG